MRKLILVSIILGLTVVAIGCAAPARAPEASAPVVVEVEKVVERQVAAQEASAAASGIANDAERMIIRTANLSIVVADAAQAQQAVVEMVNGMGGYVADSNAWREGEQLRARMTVRVPAERLDALLAAVKEMAVKVQQENVTGQDVTEEFTDLDAQLVNLEATEQELRELLTEVRQKMQKAEDVLAIHRELTSIRGEIERVKGRMQYLSTMTALATANVDLIPDVLAKPVVEPGWRPAETLKNAGRSLVSTMQGLVNAIIWLIIYVLPVLLVVATPIVALILLIRWLLRRARRKAKAPAEPVK